MYEQPINAERDYKAKWKSSQKKARSALKFNTKIRYGIRTMMEIAMHDSGHGVLQKDISRNQKISFKYLDQIIAALKAAHLITNIKGKKSGYVLTRPASQISIYDIHKAFEPEISIVDCLSEMIECEYEKYCAPHELWEGLNELIVDYLERHNLDELARKQIEYNRQIGQQSSSGEEDR